jgi:glycosyltransferase involved in cell wall biosynthesis
MSMNITFILPDIKLSGGVKIVFEYANRLCDRGHKVSVAYPIIPLGLGKKFYDLGYFKKLVSEFITNSFKNISVDWFDLHTDLIKTVTLSEKSIPDGDIVIATWWQTAYLVKRYNKNKGEKFYLIQHYETWGGPKEMVDKSYKLGLHNIVISSWLEKVIKQLGAPVTELILNGVNLKEFYPEQIERDNGEIRILMPYRRKKWKGVDDGLKVFEIVKKDYSNVRLVMFGPKPKKNELAEDVEFHVLPTKDKLRKVYNSCDIFFFPSHSEGFGLPPIEAMACKLPVVTTNVGAMSDCVINGKTALISEPKHIESMAKNIIGLIKNSKTREKIAEAGYEYVKKFTWERAVDKMEKTLLKHIKN